MAKVTPGFKLYLYQLLSRELGFGKQTLLPQVEEVLLADDILPVDLECETVQELVEACPDFLKLRVFKKGRAYATVVRIEEWDQMLAAPAEAKPADTGSKKAACGPKTWKKKKGGKKTFKAVKPGKQRREREAAQAAEEARLEAERAAAAEEEAARAAQAAAEEAAAESVAAVEAEAEVTDEAPEVTREEAVTEEQAIEEPNAEEPTSAEQPREEARTLAEIIAEAREAEAAAAAEPTPEPAPAPKPAPTPEPAPAPAPKPISLTITYDPYEDMERELARQAEQREQERLAQTIQPPAREPEPAPAPSPTAHIALGDLPQDFGRDVSCKDALLRALYHLLPYDAEPMAVLDEDWRVARSTGSLSGSRNRVTFPLRYVHEDGTPITVTLRKSARNAAGRCWSMLLVDGDDGTGTSHELVGFEGLPTADQGAWSDLSSPSETGVNPMRSFVQDVVIGSWDSLLGSLATVAAPERWNFPGEGVGRQSRYGILREYLALTYHRATRQERIAQADDGSFAAFNTGLSTALGDDIYACLTARRGDIPWQFAGFATAGNGELGARLTGTIAHLPQRPTYLSTIESVMPGQNRMVILDLEAMLTRQLGRFPRAFLADLLDDNPQARALLASDGSLATDDLATLARAIKQSNASYRRMRRMLDDAVEQAMRAVRESYRLAVPVYDPTENRTKLLVPLCLVSEGTADCALVLDLQPSGAYRAAHVLTLPRAYACARVISREQPAWLASQVALR